MRLVRCFPIPVIALLVLFAASLAAPGAALAGFTPTPVPTDTPTPLPTATPMPTDTPTATPPSPPTQPPQPPATQVLSILDPLITKEVDIAWAQFGDLVRYVIVVTNPNAVQLSAVVVTDPLPAEVDFVSATTTQGDFAYDAAAHTLVFNLGTLMPSQVVTIHLVTRVNARGQPPDVFRNGVGSSREGLPGPSAISGPVQLVPNLLPDAGYPPEAGPGPLTYLLAIGTALIPLLGSLTIWRRRGR